MINKVTIRYVSGFLCCDALTSPETSVTRHPWPMILSSGLSLGLLASSLDHWVEVEGGCVEYSFLYTRFRLTPHCTENLKQIFPEMKLHRLIPNSYIHVSGSDLYILTIGLICNLIHSYPASVPVPTVMYLEAIYIHISHDWSYL
jgi:hypothetical protein